MHTKLKTFLGHASVYLVGAIGCITLVGIVGGLGGLLFAASRWVAHWGTP